MKASEPTSKEKRLLKINYEERDELWLSRQHTLQKLIGILGMTLPLLLYAFLYVYIGYSDILPSISHYYYTRSSSIFIAVVSLMGFFLLIYKGDNKLDFYISSISGLAALMVVLYPTDNLAITCNTDFTNYVVTVIKEDPIRTTFHYLSAAIFFLGLAFISFFQFPTKQTSKKGRLINYIYRTCAIIIIISLIIIYLGKKGSGDFVQFFESHNLTFWMETVAIEAFGISWLIKGKNFFLERFQIPPIQIIS